MTLILASAVGCAGEPDISRTTTISGVVRDADTGAPLAGALVFTQPPTEQVETDAEGAFLLDDGPLLGTRYQITAEKEGYSPGTKLLVTDVAVPAQVELELQILVLCVPGERRCAQGEVPGVETCAARGEGYDLTACPANQACDPASRACTTAHALTVSTSGGGAVRSQPSGISCTPACERAFPAGAAVTLIATPFANGELVGWSGDCTGSNLTCVLTMDAPKTASAMFRSNAFGVTVQRAGGGQGRVTSEPAGIDCGNRCAATFMRDEQVTLTAAPTAGSNFVGFEGDCVSAVTTCTVTVDGAKNVRARFERITFPLTVERQGTGAGTVTSEPEGIDCGADCAADFTQNEMVTLTAAPAAGSTFMGWAGDCTGNAACIVTMDRARTVRATFEGISYTLTVVRQGTGGGRITSAPAGIDCGADCTEPYGPDTMVTLTAAPAAGDFFGTWGDACTPAGTNLQCMLTIVANTRATASFDPYYLGPLVADASCVIGLRFEAAAPLAQACGGGPDATSVGAYQAAASRVARMGMARAVMGGGEEGWLETSKSIPVPAVATLELTVRKDGAAFGGRGHAVLIGDRDALDPSGPGVRLAVYDDGRIVLGTRALGGGTTTATAAAGTLVDGAWRHVAATVSASSGIRIFVDSAQVALNPAGALWTASSSTAWVGAEREGAGGAIYRFNGAVDEVRVSNVGRY